MTLSHRDLSSTMGSGGEGCRLDIRETLGHPSYLGTDDGLNCTRSMRSMGDSSTERCQSLASIRKNVSLLAKWRGKTTTGSHDRPGLNRTADNDIRFEGQR